MLSIPFPPFRVGILVLWEQVMVNLKKLALEHGELRAGRRDYATDPTYQVIAGLSAAAVKKQRCAELVAGANCGSSDGAFAV